MKKNKITSITIGMPHNRDVTPEVFSSIFGMMGRTQADFRLNLFEGSLIHQARNYIASTCFTDYLLFVDSDMSFHPDGLNKLLALDKDIVGGLYFMRKAPYRPAVFTINKDEKYQAAEPIPDKPFQCDAIATGFMLIKKKVLDRFDQYVKDKKELPFDFLKEDLLGQLGEDMAFCHRAKELGFEIWCDPTFPIGHVHTEIIGRNNYEAYKELDTENNTPNLGGSEQETTKTDANLERKAS